MHHYRHKRRAKFAAYGWLVCCLAALFYCYEYLLRIEPSVMVPQLMQNFRIDAGGLGLLSAMYYWAYTPLQAVVGVFTDRYGPKRILTVAIGSCAVGSFIFGHAASVTMGGVGRLLIGVGSAFAFVGVLKLAAMWLHRRQFALFVGITTALGMVGAMAGDIEMVRVVQTYGWHKVISLSFFFGLLLIPIFFLFVHDKISRSKQDVAGKSLKQAFLGFWKIIKNSEMLTAGAIGCVLYLSLSVFGEMWGISFIRTMSHDRELKAATFNAMVFFGWLVGAPLNGWLSDKLKSRKKSLIVGSFLASLTMAIILLWPSLPDQMLYALLFLFGLFCSVQVLCFAIARDLAPQNMTATAVGAINMFVMLGGMVVQPFVAWVLDLMWDGKIQNNIHLYTLHAYRVALIIIPIFLIVSGILAIRLKETYKAGAY